MFSRPAPRDRPYTLSRSRYDGRLWDGDDELAPSMPVLVLLAYDLFGEVPRQDEHVVWLVLDQALGCHDGDVRARRVQALLERAAIDKELQQIRTDPVEVEQRVTLRRRSVAGQPLSLPLQIP